MSIDLVPDLAKYPHICGAHKKQTLIVFVGAGVSALWGCKRWKEMTGSLIHACYRRGKFDYWTRESLLTKYAGSPRRLITIAKGILGGDYLTELQNTLRVSDERKAQFPDLFNNLFALNAAYVTTNIDDNFSRLFDTTKVHYAPNEFNLSMTKPNNIIHLHGIISDPDSLVLTIDEYIAQYQIPRFRSFLESAFFNDDYCFLFVGYGVDEMEIIDFMVEKYSEGTKSLRRSKINRFYILLPFFQNEESLLEYERVYFQQIKMSVIPYAIDSIGHDQLHEVIERWRTDFATLDRGEFYQFSPIIERNL
jgi:hypothetical protein